MDTIVTIPLKLKKHSHSRWSHNVDIERVKKALIRGIGKLEAYTVQRAWFTFPFQCISFGGDLYKRRGGWVLDGHKCTGFSA